MARYPDPRQKVGDYPNRVVIVTDKNDLPRPTSSNIIELEDGVIYVVFGTVDLEGRRISSDGIATLSGYSPETSRVLSTGLGSETALITATNTLALNGIALEHATILDLDASTNPGAAIDWTGVNFVNATTAVGTIKDYGNAICGLIGFLNSGGLTFDGTIGTVAFGDTIFENAPGLTSLILAETLEITRRFRVGNSSFISLSGETAINVGEGAIIPNEGLILTTCNFSGGGTYLTGITEAENTARFNGNRGISNSANFAQYYMTGNETETTISTSGTFVKIAGSTSEGSTVQRFDVTSVSNRAEYTGSLSGFYYVKALLSFTSGTNNEISFQLAKNGEVVPRSNQTETANGTRNANLGVADVVELQTGDYIEVWVANESNSQNVTVSDLMVVIQRITG